MASDGGFRRASALDAVLNGTPPYWLGVLALSTPWVRFAIGPWTLYPGHLALTLLLAAVLLAERGWVAALRPLSPLLALGAYMAAVAAMRGDWSSALIAGGVTAAHFAWGAAAMRLGMGGSGVRPVQEALVLLLAATLLAGLLAWAAQAAWPAGCRVLNCREDAVWPFAFTGGWGSAGRYAVLLMFLLPAVGGPLLTLLRAPGVGGDAGRRWVLPALIAGAGVGLVAGAPAWALLLAAAGWLLLHRLLGRPQRDPERLVLRALAAGGAFAMVLVYGLEPGYLHRWGGSESGLPPVQVTLPEAPPRGLTSDGATALSVTVRNAGWSRIGGNGAGPLYLGVRYMVTPQRGSTRAFDGPTVPVPGALAPGQSRTVEVPVRPPHWIRDAYLTWRLELGDGRSAPLAQGSHPGFRFINHGHRRLAHDPENQLTVLAARARAFARETVPPSAAEPSAHSVFMVAGDVLDTLFFSPLWGEDEPSSAGVPLSTRRPLLPALLHQYGLIGLALAAWVLWRLFHRAALCGQRGEPGWLLLPISLVLLAAAGLFTPALGSYHGVWAFFLLAGFLEGRYARAYPWPRLRLAPPVPWRLRLPRLRRRRAPRRVPARRVRR